MTIVLFKSFLTTLFIYFVGISFSKIFFNTLKKNIFEYIFFGFLTIGFIALFLNFFLPLTNFINSITFFFFFICALFLIKEFDKKIILSHFLIIILISFFAFLLIFKANIFRPDAGLYHLPFTKILNSERIILGLSNLHFRFGHISIVQYINAINYNFLTTENGILFPITTLVSTFIVYLISEIKKSIKHNDFVFQYFLILIFIFSITYLERYSDYGNDASGYIYSMLCLIYFLKIKKVKPDQRNYLLDVLILFSFFSFLNKTFLILFLFLPFFFVRKNNLIKLLKNKITLFIGIFFIFWCIKNLLISGCFLYPLPITCVDFIWTDIQQTKYFNAAGEAASKGYLDIMKYKIENAQISIYEFNKNFNWLKIWSQFHFFKIIEKLFPFLIFIFLFFLYKFFSSKEENVINTNKLNFLCIFSIISFVFWFLKFPLYRYGVSYIILLVLSFSILIFHKFKFALLKKKEIYFLSYLSLIIFLGINFKRIFTYNEIREDLPSLYSMGENVFYKQKRLNNIEYYFADSECMYTKSLCTHLDVKISAVEKYGFKIFYK